MGDVIYFLDTNGIPEHMALYVSKKNDTHYVVHATTVPHRGVMITYLREPDFSCNYQVLRPIDTELSQIALGIILNWVEQKIPFTTDKRRESLMDRLEDRNGYTPKFARKIQEAYAKSTYVQNYSHYLDMANALPSIPREAGEITGLACSETIVSAFNIALLIRHASYNPEEKVTGNMFSLPDISETFIRSLANPFPLDAKAVAPAGLIEHCLNDSKQWLDKGLLIDYSPSPPTSEEKIEWKAFIEAFKQSTPQVNVIDAEHSFEILVPSEFSEEHDEKQRRFDDRQSPLTFLNSTSSDSPTKTCSRSPSSPYQFLGLAYALSQKIPAASESAAEIAPPKKGMTEKNSAETLFKSIDSHVASALSFFALEPKPMQPQPSKSPAIVRPLASTKSFFASP